MKPRWAVDWDGTCCEDVWPKMGAWMPGAVSALRTLSEHGEVVIHTCRIAPWEPGELIPRSVGLVESEKNAIRRKLDAEGLHTIRIWDKAYKPPADAYIDNKGIHYNGRKNAWKVLVPKLLLMAGLQPDWGDDD